MKVEKTNCGPKSVVRFSPEEECKPVSLPEFLKAVERTFPGIAQEALEIHFSCPTKPGGVIVALRGPS